MKALGGHSCSGTPGFYSAFRPDLVNPRSISWHQWVSSPGFFSPVEVQKDSATPFYSQFPAPGGPPGQALSSSPARTWPPAPRLPSPVHSLREGPRPGSCCGPGCSTPPPWGCGRGSCRSLLGRWKRVVCQAGLNPCAPS